MPAITLENVAREMKAPAVDRTERYSARLEAHLKTLPDDGARHEFCRKELANWIERYNYWAAAVDAGRLEVEAGGATAFDYTLTIAAIRQFQNRYAPLGYEAQGTGHDSGAGAHELQGRQVSP